MGPAATVQHLSASVQRYFKLGSARRRRLYERVKRCLNHRTCVQRRRTAVELADAVSFTIPRDRGFLGFPPTHFEEMPAILADARARLSTVDVQRSRQPKVTTDGLYVHLLDPRELTLDSPYLRFVLRRDVIAAVSRYLGMVPVLGQIDLWHSGPCAQWNNSHLYHCDWSALTQVKIFVYCSDVSLENGPLTVVPADRSQAIHKRLHYNYRRDGGRYRVSDECMREHGGQDHQHALVGPAGSAVLADTSRCFHFGSRVLPGAAPRWLALFQLIPPSAFQLPVHFQSGAPFRRLIHPGLPQYQRLVLGAE